MQNLSPAKTTARKRRGDIESWNSCETEKVMHAGRKENSGAKPGVSRRENKIFRHPVHAPCPSYGIKA